MFKDAKQSIFSTIKKGESRFKKVKDHFLSNFNKKIEVNIESVFKEFKVDMSVGGTCTTDSCNVMINFCFTLLDLKFDDNFVFPIKLLPYLECAISIIPAIKSDICVGLGPNFNFETSDENSFDIDISGGASVSVTIDFGVYFPSLTSPVRLSFNVGLVGVLGAGRAGVKLSLYFKNKFMIDLYYEFKACELSFYVMFTLTFELKIMNQKISFSFSFYIFQKTFGAFKYEFHKERIYYYKKSKLAEKNRITTKNGGHWGKKKVNQVKNEVYESL